MSTDDRVLLEQSLPGKFDQFNLNVEKKLGENRALGIGRGASYPNRSFLDQDIISLKNQYNERTLGDALRLINDNCARGESSGTEHRSANNLRVSPKLGSEETFAHGTVIQPEVIHYVEEIFRASGLKITNDSFIPKLPSVINDILSHAKVQKGNQAIYAQESHIISNKQIDRYYDELEKLMFLAKTGDGTSSTTNSHSNDDKKDAETPKDHGASDKKPDQGDESPQEGESSNPGGDKDKENNSDKPEEKKEPEEDENEEEEQKIKERFKVLDVNDPEGYNILTDKDFADLETKSEFPEDEILEEENVVDQNRAEFYDVLDRSRVVAPRKMDVERKLAKRKVIPPIPQGGWLWRPARFVSEESPVTENDDTQDNSQEDTEQSPGNSPPKSQSKPVNGHVMKNKANYGVVWKLEYIDAQGGEVEIEVTTEAFAIAEYKSKTNKPKHHKFEVGSKVDVLDYFISKRNGIKLKKWRQATVIAAEAYWLRVHYENWNPVWDEWVHVYMDSDRISEFSKQTKKIQRRIKRRNDNFQKVLERKRGLKMVDMDADGNCLFRTVAHQVYGNPEKHKKVRAETCDYMAAHKDRFKMFVGNVDAHIRKMRLDREWGDDTEIRAMEEVYDRPFEIYAVAGVGISYIPMKIHFDGDLPKSSSKVEPIRLSYHGQCHYNSIVPVALKMKKTSNTWSGLPRRTTHKIQNHREGMLKRAEEEDMKRIAASREREREERARKAREEKEEEVDEDDIETVVIHSSDVGGKEAESQDVDEEDPMAGDLPFNPAQDPGGIRKLTDPAPVAVPKQTARQSNMNGNSIDSKAKTKQIPLLKGNGNFRSSTGKGRERRPSAVFNFGFFRSSTRSVNGSAKKNDAPATQQGIQAVDEAAMPKLSPTNGNTGTLPPKGNGIAFSGHASPKQPNLSL